MEELRANIDYENRQLKINGFYIPLDFEDDDSIEEEFTEELRAYVNTIGFKDDLFRLDHLNGEEKAAINKSLRKYSDLFFKEGDTLTV